VVEALLLERTLGDLVGFRVNRHGLSKEKRERGGKGEKRKEKEK